MSDITRPPKPAVGKFQTTFWDDDYGFWKIRDLTEQERNAKFPPPTPPDPSTIIDYDTELIANIQAATTIAGLKAALIGSIEGSRARISGKPK